MPFSAEFLEKVDRLQPELREVMFAFLSEVERIREEGLRRAFDDFSRRVEEYEGRVWKAITELAESHRRAEERLTGVEERLTRLEKTVGELAEAHRRAEERLTGVEERLTRLEKTVGELAEAHRRAEERLTGVEERLTRLEKTVGELAEAQRRTEVEVRALTKGLKETRKMVGGLSDAVGYGLEDRAIKSLPGLLKERYGIEVREGPVRKYVTCNGGEEELNLFGKGVREGREITILGEAKARLSKRHIDDFIKRVGELERYRVVRGDRLLLVITYTSRPEVEEYARSKGVEVVWSYEI